MARHIDIPTPPELTDLLDERDPASVSIYVPTSPLPQDADGDRIAFKNLAREAIAQLEAAQPARGAVAGIRDQVDDVLEDDDFWRLRARSLAAFVTPARMRTFRLPNELTGMVEVSDRMHVKPLLRSVTFPQAAVVLVLAQGSVRLLEIARDLPPEEIAVAELPQDAASAVGTASITERAAIGRIQGSEGQKVRMRQYARLIERAVRPVVAGLGVPLILACAEPLGPIYRSVNRYPGLVDDTISGNPESATDAELSASARTILDEFYAHELRQVRELFETRVAQGRGASDLTDVARAATFGAVETLMVDIDAVVPGFIDAESGKITLHERDDAVNYGVVDEIARRVLAADGRVLALRAQDIPHMSSTAAILRYPV